MRLIPLVCTLLVGFLPQLAVAGPVFVYEDPSGVVRFSNKAPRAGETAKRFSAREGGFSVVRGIQGGRGRPISAAVREKYRDLIIRACRTVGVEIALVRALIHAESGYNYRAVSPKGARGLMQLMPSTWRELGVSDPFDPKQNVYAGVRYLASLLRSYGGDKRLALAAYNAGPGAVDAHGGVPPFSETRAYVQRVLELQKIYQGQS